MSILENRTKWSSTTSSKAFESGALVGQGTIKLVISQLPTRIIKILKFVGFSGDRNTGINYLMKISSDPTSVNCNIARILLLVFHCYVETVFGLGTDLKQVEKLLIDFPQV